MGSINICNSAGRDAVVSTESVGNRLAVRWLDGQGRQTHPARILKSTVAQDLDALMEQVGELSNVSQALIEGDPEVNTEMVGSLLKDTSRVYIDLDRKIVHKVQQFEIIRNPDGSERERRPRVVQPANVTDDLPLKWSGVLIKKDEACRKFVFSAKMQIHHINGLTYDFLYAMAKELEEQKSLMLLGAGPKSNQPLILRRGSTPHRGFLEGRTQGDKYCLVLHLSNLELKAPVANTE
jgi:hypothetical protein